MASKMEIGRRYRRDALILLARLGYATTRQVAMGLLGGCSLSERKQISRTLRWLIETGHVVEKRDNDSINGERMVALTRLGAAAVTEDMPLPGGHVHARDWLRHAHKHRTACNSAWVALYRGLVPPGWTELEIRKGEAPPDLSLFRYISDGENLQKIPDLLLDNFQGEKLDRPIWVEVENAWRGAHDFRKLIGFLRAIFGMSAPPISAVWFVVTADGARTIGGRLRAAMTHGLDSAYARPFKELDAHILTKRIQVLSLDAGQLELTVLPF